MLSDEQLSEVFENVLRLEKQCLDLCLTFTCATYRNEAAKEVAIHGFSRRLQLISHCVVKLFELLPPSMGTRPSKQDVQTATALVQCSVLNTYGALDNLAHVWNEENFPRKENGRTFGRTEVGFSCAKKYIEFRSKLPVELQKRLEGYAEWFEYLEDYRHSLDHRIPLYIPDRSFVEEDLNKLASIREKQEQAWKALDYAEVIRLGEEEGAIGHFNPMMVHSLKEGGAPVLFHFQARNDLATLVDLGTHFHRMRTA